MWKMKPPKITNGNIFEAIDVTGTIAIRHCKGA